MKGYHEDDGFNDFVNPYAEEAKRDEARKKKGAAKAAATKKAAPKKEKSTMQTIVDRLTGYSKGDKEKAK